MIKEIEVPQGKIEATNDSMYMRYIMQFMKYNAETLVKQELLILIKAID